MAAVRRDLVIHNVASLVRARDEPVDSASPMSVEEVGRVVEAIRGRDDAAPWSLVLGMRPAACLGLAWGAVDLGDGRLRVQQQLVAVYPYRHGCAEGETRVPEPPRPLLPEPDRGSHADSTEVKGVAAQARAARRGRRPAARAAGRWVAMRLESGTAWNTSRGDLVFTGPLGHPLNQEQGRVTWQVILEEAGAEDHSLYDARHTAATLLAEEGADIQQVKEQLGHSQIRDVAPLPAPHRPTRQGLCGAARWSLVRALSRFQLRLQWGRFRKVRHRPETR